MYWLYELELEWGTLDCPEGCSGRGGGREAGPSPRWLPLYRSLLSGERVLAWSMGR